MVGTILNRAGASDRQIADPLGQKTEAMARYYSRDANLANRNRTTMETLDPETENRTEVVKRSARGIKQG